MECLYGFSILLIVLFIIFLRWVEGRRYQVPPLWQGGGEILVTKRFGGLDFKQADLLDYLFMIPGWELLLALILVALSTFLHLYFLGPLSKLGGSPCC